MNEPLNANGKCKDCRKINYCKKPCTQAKRRMDALMEQNFMRALAGTEAGKAMIYTQATLDAQNAKSFVD